TTQHNSDKTSTAHIYVCEASQANRDNTTAQSKTGNCTSHPALIRERGNGVVVWWSGWRWEELGGMRMAHIDVSLLSRYEVFDGSGEAPGSEANDIQDVS